MLTLFFPVVKKYVQNVTLNSYCLFIMKNKTEPSKKMVPFSYVSFILADLIRTLVGPCRPLQEYRPFQQIIHFQPRRGSCSNHVPALSGLKFPENCNPKYSFRYLSQMVYPAIGEELGCIQAPEYASWSFQNQKEPLQQEDQ